MRKSRFNRTFPDAVPDLYLFSSLSEVRNLTNEWIGKYNEERPAPWCPWRYDVGGVLTIQLEVMGWRDINRLQVTQYTSSTPTFGRASLKYVLWLPTFRAKTGYFVSTEYPASQGFNLQVPYWIITECQKDY